ncbi:MAG TPA: hypothetical protein VHV77_15625, partial [Pirellulales bacterium]|nr:hypothetical protein [Pirellulales bacterium]
ACYLDNFDACFAALNDPQDKTMWSGLDAPYILELRAALARSPEAATKLRQTIEKQRSPDAAALYRMFWGYSAEDLANGAGRDLVEGLDKESLDYRVLAFWNLQSITGLPSYGYHPVETTAKRKQPVKAWQQRLKEGKIVPRSAAAAPGVKSKGAAGKSTDRS